MSLVKCRECGKDVSSTAKSCPHCGVSHPATKTWQIVVMALIILAGIASMISSGKDEPTTKAGPAKQTPAQIAEEARQARTLIYMKLIKENLREPDSVQWDKALASEKGETVCIRYRARNGFGGMNIEYFVIDVDKVWDTQEFWDKHCNRAVYNVMPK